jgi:hypothetical protein
MSDVLVNSIIIPSETATEIRLLCPVTAPELSCPVTAEVQVG